MEGDAGGAGDVLRGDAAGDAVFPQGAGGAHEVAGSAPQRAGQGGQFMGAGDGQAAFPGRDVVGGDVGHSVGGAHAVGDVAGSHPDFLAQDACGACAEGEWRMHAARVGSDAG